MEREKDERTGLVREEKDVPWNVNTIKSTRNTKTAEQRRKESQIILDTVTTRSRGTKKHETKDSFLFTDVFTMNGTFDRCVQTDVYLCMGYIQALWKRKVQCIVARTWMDERMERLEQVYRPTMPGMRGIQSDLWSQSWPSSSMLVGWFETSRRTKSMTTVDEVDAHTACSVSIPAANYRYREHS